MHERLLPERLRLLAILCVAGLLVAACRGPEPASERIVGYPSALPQPVAIDRHDPTLGPSPVPSPARVAAQSRATVRGRQPATTPGGSTPAGPPPDPTSNPGAPSSLDAADIRLAHTATVNQPVAMAIRPGDPYLYFAERTGRVWVFRDGQILATPVLDISTEVATNYEQGLLGLAFSPDGQFLYIHFTGNDWDVRIREYPVEGPGRLDVLGARLVMRIPQPSATHNGGQLKFGPDGMLYISLGDGSHAGDPDNLAQDLSTLHGTVLRISPRPEGGQAYTVPADNPFIGREGARPEIWAYGLRNPWRASFDRQTGDFWIADVGQNRWEEVNFQPAGSSGGENYGWSLMEGSQRYKGEAPPDHVPPLYEYYQRDNDNCAITGGYVYRGGQIPELQGAYLFADHCVGELRAITQEAGQVTQHRFLGASAAMIVSFGEDHDGELWVLSIEGRVYKIVPA